jgi:peptidoglycan hydrolase-like protein with peptidoglycan-binding domain
MGIALTDKQKEIPADPGSYLSGTESKTTEGKKRGPVFRATKEQIMEAQKILREKGFYKGEESGKLDPATRAALRAYQEGNGLKATGTLNAATLEKMGIELTEKQKERVVLRTP